MDDLRKMQIGITIEKVRHGGIDISPAELQTALDLEMPLLHVKEIIDAYNVALKDVVTYHADQRRVRREALKNLTQESQNVEGGYR